MNLNLDFIKIKWRKEQKNDEQNLWNVIQKGKNIGPIESEYRYPQSKFIWNRLRFCSSVERFGPNSNKQNFKQFEQRANIEFEYTGNRGFNGYPRYPEY